MRTLVGEELGEGWCVRVRTLQIAALTSGNNYFSKSSSEYDILAPCTFKWR